MIKIFLKSDEFIHDIYALVKAFYPGAEVTAEVAEGDSDFCLYLQDGTKLEAEIEPAAAGTSRLEAKSHVKRQVYDYLRKWTGDTLPWGTLTGIRPTKIVMRMMERGVADADIYQHMETQYYTSREKTALSLDIARREREVLKEIDDRNGYSLYIGIPFCPTTCLYCSFTSYPIEKWQQQMDRYLETVLKEVDFIAAACHNRAPDTIYIGGGTPTTLEAGQLDRLLHGLEERLPMERVKEFSVEAGRPDSITRAKLEVLKSHGVTRISINPQTMNQKTLDLIGRKHSTGQVIEAFHMAREVGLDNINMDLIVGLPGERETELAHTLQQVEELGPDSLTVHSLAVKRAAALHRWGEEAMQGSMTNTAEMMQMTADLADRMKMTPYYLYRQKNMAGNFENTGYAKVDKAGIYNILIMEEKQSILAAGAGAVSKFVKPDGQGMIRAENVKDVNQYMERISEMIERKRRNLL